MGAEEKRRRFIMSMPQYVNWKQSQTTVIGSVYGYKNLRLQFLLDCPNKVMFGGNPWTFRRHFYNLTLSNTTFCVSILL